VYTLKIKEQFKTIMDKIQFYLKTMADENLKKVDILELLYKNGDFSADKAAKILNEEKPPLGHYEVFVIDKNYKVIDASFKPDIGLDLGQFKIYKKLFDDVFAGKITLDVSPPHMDTYSMNVKEYYLFRSPDGKYLLQVAYVIDIYNLMNKLREKLLNDVPNLKTLDIFFLEDYFIVKVRFGKKPSKKPSVLENKKMTVDNFLLMVKEMGINKKTLKKYLQKINDGEATYASVISEILAKKGGKSINLDLANRKLVIYTTIKGIFDNKNGFVIRNVFTADELIKNIENLRQRFLLTFLVLIIAIFLVYKYLIFRISSDIRNIVDKMTQNQPVNIKTYITEISELSRIYNNYRNKLNSEIQKNRQLLQENKRFIVDTIHQIKTPLSVITLNVDYIKNKINDEELKEILEEIEAAVTMLTNSYEDLSYLSGNGVVKYEAKEKINLSAIVKERIHFFLPVANANNKKIIADIEENILFKINKIEFERIVDNNLSNAIKYSTKPDIFVSFKRRDGKIILKFASYGERIKYPHFVFDKNYREHSHKRGLGIGLNIVKEICEKYNIEYKVYYEDGKNIFEYIFNEE
jgi:signal transduction histidine kinase